MNHIWSGVILTGQEFSLTSISNTIRETQCLLCLCVAVWDFTHETRRKRCRRQNSNTYVSLLLVVNKMKLRSYCWMECRLNARSFSPWCFFFLERSQILTLQSSATVTTIFISWLTANWTSFGWSSRSISYQNVSLILNEWFWLLSMNIFYDFKD